MLSTPSLVLYFYVFLIVFLWGGIERKRVNFSFFSLCVILILLFIGLRGINIGDDTINYYQSFNLDLYLDTIAYESTWILICKLIKDILHLDFQFVLLLYSALTIIPVAYVSYKKSPYPLFSLFLFVFLGYAFHSMNIMRQAVAMSISLMAIYEINERRWNRAILCYLLASFFHYSAFIIAPLLLFVFCYGRLSEKGQMVAMVISLLIGFLFYSRINGLLEFVSIEKYQTYSTYAVSRNANIGNLFIINVIKTIFTLLLLGLNKTNSLFITVFGACCFLTNLIGYNIGFNRVLYYLSISTVVAIPQIIDSGNVKKIPFFVLKNPILFAYFFVLIVMLIYSICNNVDGVFPFNEAI